MINVLSRLEDLECTEFYKNSDKLKELLKEGAVDYCSINGIGFSWVSDSHIVLDEEDDDVEIEIEYLLDDIYFNFIDELEEQY